METMVLERLTSVKDDWSGRIRRKEKSTMTPGIAVRKPSMSPRN